MYLIDKFLKKKYSKSSILNILLKGISLILGLVSTPLLLNYLGDEKYGVWATILAIVTWINYFDIGIGNGLRNYLPKCIKDNDYLNAKNAIAMAYIILSVISVVLYSIVIVLTVVIDWNKFLGFREPLDFIMLVNFGFIFLNFVLSIINSVLYAFQKSEMVALISCFAQIINICGLVVLSRISDSNLLLVSILMGGSTTFSYLLSTVLLFRKKTQLFPNSVHKDNEQLKEITNLGIQFFCIQITCLMFNSTSNVIISNTLGADKVTGISIYERIFSSLYTLWCAFVIPYWSLTTKNKYEKKINNIRSDYKMLLKHGVVVAILFFILCIFIKPCVYVWLGRNLEIDDEALLVLALFYAASSICEIYTIMLNGLGKLKEQFYIELIKGVVCIVLAYLMGAYTKYGVVGIKFVYAASMLVCAIIYPCVLKKYLKLM